MSPEFYPPELTDQSRRVLDKVLATVPDAVLIGGWGTWAHLGSMPSHDIDLMVDHAQLDLLRTRFGEITASTHVDGRKWRGSVEGIHLDLYVSYQSRLGQALQLRVEQLTTASELGGGRGGPRCLSCAVTRDPAAEPAEPAGPETPAGRVTRPDLAPIRRSAPEVSSPQDLGAETRLLVQAQ
ncbi:MAG: hypothetical protein DLM54_10640 [Acidimicrobiales bacterium]|nr:MAG: hypothetical protein DLM54_10640 [Acidimicrobiales bacterium]